MAMPKYDRMLHILNLLRTHRHLTASALARECGVTVRSIYRDILALSEADVPIYYDNGYKLSTENFLPPLNFSFEEYKALRLALESTPLNLTGKYADILRKIRAKVESNLPEAVREKRRAAVLPTTISIDVSQARNQAEKYFGIIEQAVEESNCLEIDYEAVGSGRATRIIEPYFIVFRGRAFYVVAYCQKRQDFRTFRVDQIKSLTRLDTKFTPRSNIDARSYFDGSWQVFSGEAVQVTVRFFGIAARIVSTRSHHPNETIEKVGDDEIIYRVTVRGIEEIQRWILGFGEQAQVLEPEEIKWNLARIGARFREVYGQRGAVPSKRRITRD